MTIRAERGAGMGGEATLRRVERDVEEIRGLLGQLEEHLREARAAADVLADGDPTALADLDGTVDEMAHQIAALKAKTAAAGF